MDSEKQEWRSEPQLEQPLKLSTWTLAQAEQMLRIQRRSGLSVVAFCRRVGIKQHRLYAEPRKQSQQTPLTALSAKELLRIRADCRRSSFHCASRCRFRNRPWARCVRSSSHPCGVRLQFSAQIPESLARALCSVLGVWMLSLPPSVRVYVAPNPVDARKGFDGLSLYVLAQLQLDPLSGHLFVFFNRRLIKYGFGTGIAAATSCMQSVWNADDSAFLSSGQSRVRAEKLKPQSWRFVWRELTCRLLRAVRAGNGM